MLKTRRRRRWATLASLLGLVGVVGSQWPTIRDRPWSLAPLFVLERFAPSRDMERYWDPIAADWIVHPVALELASRLKDGAFSRINWARVIRESPILRTRLKWPIGQPYAVAMEMPEWAGAVEIKLHPRVLGWRWAQGGSLLVTTSGTWVEEAYRYQELGLLQPEMTEVVFDISASAHAEQSDGLSNRQSPVQTYNATIRVPVEVVKTYDEAIAPVNDPVLDQSILKSLHATPAKSHVSPYEWTVVTAADPLIGFGGEPLEFAVAAELLKDGVAVEYCEFDTADDWYFLRNGMSSQRYKAVFGDHDLRSLVREEPGRWRVRLEGAPHRALRNFDADRYWAGSIEVPAETLVKSEASRGGQ